MYFRCFPFFVAMYSADRCLFVDSIRVSRQGGLFLSDKTVPSSFVSSIPLKTQKCFVDKNENVCLVSCSLGGQTLDPGKPRRSGGKGGWVLAVSLTREEGYVGDSGEDWAQNGDNKLETVEKVKEKKGSGALNTTKHLWAGAVAAMVSRFYLSFSPFFLKKNCWKKWG